MKQIIRLALFIIAYGLQNASAQSWVLNNPYPASELGQNIYYSSFSEQPKTLDPARSYSANEYLFIGQIYEPLLEYDYFIRPYKLIPLLAESLPEISYLDSNKKTIAEKDPLNPAFTRYLISIKKGVLYQPHPALARDVHNRYRYHHLADDYLDKQGIRQLSDFKHTGTREVVADDFIYQMKRLANPAVSSPILGLLSDYIVGFEQYGQTLPKAHGRIHFVDLRNYPLEGINKVDDYHFEIILKGRYTQFSYWLAMPFFSPIPWEADKFYSQYDMDDKNLTFGWYPIGTGPFMLTLNNPNRHMVLEKNPSYRPVYFPKDATHQGQTVDDISNEEKKLPLIDKAIYVLEKESIPRWNKFLQGYYDMSGISADSFDQAIRINQFGEAVLSEEMQAKKMYLTQTLEPNIFYMGFNMLDSVVGGTSNRARNLRQAISIAVNYDENIAIFYNGRGRAAQGPIPPGIFGYKEGKEGINPYVYKWHDNNPVRRPIADAKKLMVQAGYPNGINPKTGKALILHYDVPSGSGPESKSLLDWMRKQFAHIGIELNVRATLYNRFQEKMRTGNAQIFSWGWNADYPDPENFLFQLYGRNAKVRYGGENAANYDNRQFDRLFERMKNRANDAERQRLIDKMLELVRRDAPWVWGMHSESFLLSQDWVSHVKANTISLSTLKYVSVDTTERDSLRRVWNKPVFWPLGLLGLILLGLTIPLVIAYYQKERQAAPRINTHD